MGARTSCATPPAVTAARGHLFAICGGHRSGPAAQCKGLNQPVSLSRLAPYHSRITDRRASPRIASRSDFDLALCVAMRSHAKELLISGRQDLNLRPLGPQPSALPDCATPRGVFHFDGLGGAVPMGTSVRVYKVRRMGRCSRCKAEKPDAEFAWRRRERGQRDTYCRPCRAEYKQEHYAANKARYIASARQRKIALLEERAQYVVAFLREHPCVDCGEDDPIVLEFDHLRDKKFSISEGLQGRRWQDVLDEIAKCEVVCANCHRRRTAKRGGFRRAAVAQR